MAQDKSRAEKVTPVKEGDRVPYLEETIVRPPCSEKKGGHWYCVTHREHLEHNFAKDNHIMEGKHQMAWVCHEHGLEQP